MPYGKGMESNLRNLASLAAEEHGRRRSQWKAILILAISVALGIGALVYALNEVARTQPPKVVIDPAKLPPVPARPAR